MRELKSLLEQAPAGARWVELGISVVNTGTHQMCLIDEFMMILQKENKVRPEVLDSFSHNYW